MFNQDYTAKLLQLEDIIVTNVEDISNKLHIHLELPRKEHECPSCGAHTSRVHDYREQVIKDIPFGRTTMLHLRKRRYCCQECGKRFAEENPFLPRYHRATSRLIAAIIQEFRKLTPATEIASRFHVSATTAVRYFDHVNYSCHELPEVLSIDEFKGSAGGQKYQTILTSPEKHKILDILPNRFESDLIAYFQQFEDRSAVKYFVSDMNPHFRSVAKTCFPDAVIVVDRYHVVRLAVWAMERVRRNEQAKLSRKFRRYFKRSNSLLNKPIHELTEDDMNRLAQMFEISPRLADAYYMKNEFVKVMRCDSSAKGRALLLGWLESVGMLDLPEFDACVTACRNWFHEILNSMDVPWSNGFTEGCNNKTKVLKRICFGMRNFRRFRSRILHCSDKATEPDT